MPIERLIKTDNHRTLELLSKRQVLDEKLKKLYFTEESGYIGEQLFADFLTNHLDNEPITFFNFRFVVNDSECQIDCLLIFQNECILIEVKNYSGRYVFNKGDMYFYPTEKKLIKQPFGQITRAKDMLSELFTQLNVRIPISEQLVFINPNFYLFNVGPSEPVTFHSTLKNFVDELNQKRVLFNDYHYKVFEKLNSVRLISSSYSKKIEYEYATFSKGITCANCDGWMKIIGVRGRKNMCCDKCEEVESIDDAVFRSIREFNFLFPEKKITVPIIAEWVNDIVSQHKIRTVLLTRCVPIGENRHRHFLIKTSN